MNRSHSLQSNPPQTRRASEGFRGAIETRSASEGFPDDTLGIERDDSGSQETLARASGLSMDPIQTRSASKGFPGDTLGIERDENGSQETLARASGLCGAVPRRAFTLIELLITISIIGLMASMVLFATYSAMEEAKAQKTRALVAKLDAVIKAKWEAYRTRRVPVSIVDEFLWYDRNFNGNVDAGEFDDPNGNGILDNSEYSDLNANLKSDVYPISTRTRMKLIALRDLMRMELPDRWSDVSDAQYASSTPNSPTSVPIARPARSQAYLRQYLANTTRPNAPSASVVQDFEGAECLYMIVMEALQEEGDSRDVFKSGDVGDVDGDGFPEFIDGWGRPIKFIRWPVGFPSELNAIASGRCTQNPGGDPHVVEFLLDLSASPNVELIEGRYTGAVIAASDAAGNFDPTRAATITNFFFDSGTSAWKFVCSTPSWARQKPFDRNGPVSSEFVILAGDPFDPSRTFPWYTDTSGPPPNPDLSAPTFATYPLIFSSGPNKCYGIATFLDSSGLALHYANYDMSDPTKSVGMNPFFMDATSKRMMAMPLDNPNEEFFVTRGWQDNIHNHLQGLK